MNEETCTTTFWMQGYLPTGRKVSFTVRPGDDYAAIIRAAFEFEGVLAAHGVTVEQPGLEPGEKKETIVTCMRREKPFDGTPIIDYYPEWGDGGDPPFGTYKALHLYLDKNKPEMTAEFLATSGFKSIDDIPLYDAQSPLKRTKGKVHPKETAVPTPFIIVKKEGAEKIGSDGQPYKPWELVRYEKIGNLPTLPADAPAPITEADIDYLKSKVNVTPTANGSKVETVLGAGDNRRVGTSKPVGEWPSVIGQVSSQEAVTTLYSQYNHRKAMIDLLITHGILHGALTPDAAIERITAYHAASAQEDFVGGATDKVRRERALETVKEKYGLSGLKETA